MSLVPPVTGISCMNERSERSYHVFTYNLQYEPTIYLLFQFLLLNSKN
jgi:hypothetical protein